jgi:hypothetical protein
MNMTRAHYHVTANTAGYLPDTNDMYLTKEAAMNGARWTKDTWLAAWPEAKASGNKRDGYRIDRDPDPSSHTLPVYVAWSRCTDESCDIEADSY